MKKFITDNFLKYKEIIMYGIFGVLTTIVNIVTFKIFRTLKIAMEASNVLAWIISVLFAYITNKKYVFDSKTKNKKDGVRELVSFITARVVSLVIDMGLMILLVRVITMNEDLAKILSNVVVIIVNYILSKLFVFKKK